MKKKMICFLLIVLCSFGFIDVRAKLTFYNADCPIASSKCSELGIDCSKSQWVDIPISKLGVSSSSGDFCKDGTTENNTTCDLGCITTSASKASDTSGTLKSLSLLFNVDASKLPSGTTLDNGGYCRSICFDSDSYKAADLPTEAVKQGTRFVWGGKNPLLTVSATRECVVSFDYDGWNAEYTKLVKTVNILSEKLNELPDSKSAAIVRSCENGGAYQWKDEYQKYMCSDGSDAIEKTTCTDVTISTSDNKYKIKYEYKKTNGKCEVQKKDIEVVENKLKGMITRIDELNTEASGCNNKASNVGKPNVCTNEGAAYVSYDDEVYGYKTDSGKREVLVEYLEPIEQTKDESDSSHNKSASVGIYNCTVEKGCFGEESISVPIFKITTLITTVDWYLKDDFYTCVSIDGYSYLRGDKCKNNDGSNTWLSGYSESFGSYSNYVTLETPNFPVNFNSKIGKHNLTLTYNCNGKKGGGDCSYNVSECINGKCPEVENGECDPSKENCDNGNNDDNNNNSNNGMINVIYRVIDLNNPFPNREPGSNWNKENYVNDYITNNRDVKTDDVYSEKKPMYEIDLDPSLIKEIRNDYKDVNYGDMNLYCTNGNECRSEFVKELYENGKLSGCGTNSNFNACESGD